MKIEIFQDTKHQKQAYGEDGSPLVDGDGNPVLEAKWTFTVDGQPSLYYSPNEHGIRRVVERLRQGRSREAFGGSGVVVDGAGVVQAVAHLPSAIGSAGAEAQATKQGRGCVTCEDGPVAMAATRANPKKVKPRGGNARKVFRATVDGKCLGKTFASEAEAKAACAIACFMTRGKLGKLAETAAAFEAQLGRKATVAVCPERHAVVCRDEAGVEYAFGVEPGGAIRFKAKEG